MPWVKRKRKLTLTKAADVRQTGPTRTVLADGTIEEVSAAMGRCFDVPADPRPVTLDLRPDAPGWGRQGR
jgi:hypothetical protein